MHLEVVASYFSQRPMKHDDQRDYVHGFGMASIIPTSTCIHGHCMPQCNMADRIFKRVLPRSGFMEG